jgi:hypothetical protein
MDGEVEVGGRTLGIGILPCSAHCPYFLSSIHHLTGLNKDLVEMRIVIISACYRFIDPDVVTTSNGTRRLPAKLA